MGWKVISKEYASPLLIFARRTQRGWRRWQLAEAAEIAPREVALLETPGHRPNLDTLERVANALLLSLPEFLKLAGTVPLPAPPVLRAGRISSRIGSTAESSAGPARWC